MEDCSPYNNYIIVRTKYRQRRYGAGLFLPSFRMPTLYRLSAQRYFRFRFPHFLYFASFPVPQPKPLTSSMPSIDTR